MKAREEGGLDSRGPDAPAARSIANHDLLGVRTVARADVPGIHTLLTTVVDYLGKRIVAQSIIPGILQGEHASSHVYGSVDEGETIASQEDVRDRMKLLSSKLYIGERTVKPRGKLLQVSPSTPTEHRGPRTHVHCRMNKSQSKKMLQSRNLLPVRSRCRSVVLWK